MNLKPYFQDLRKYRNLVAVVFVFCMVATLSFLATSNMDHSSARASTDGFNPGNIMSDAVMGNYTSMTQTEIQNFLTAKGNCNNTNYNSYLSLKAQYPKTTWNFKNGKFVCLAEEVFGLGNTFGDSVPAGEGQTAAEIIYEAAQDYKINPQVLIVLLEKEQGLISHSYPNSRQYRSATGYGCPDTAACDSKYYGFRNQVRNAASMFRTVLDGGWSNYPAGRTMYVQYNPSAKCGGSQVYIENRATSALYRYTPYQPNAAALAAGYGTTGDTCGAYGNRNFYLYFTDWFGDTHAEENIQVSDYQSIPEGNFVIASGLTYDTILTASGNANGANIAMNARSKTKNDQHWKAQYHPEDHTYTFINVANGKVLDLNGQSTNDGGNIHLYESNNTCAQRWYITVNSDGSKALLSACGRTAAMTVNSTSKNVEVSYRSVSSAAQKWHFIPDAAVADGLYSIALKANDKLQLDIAGGVSSLANNTNVQLYENNNSAAQKWQLKYNSQDGTYTFTNPNRGLVLDVQSGGIDNGSNVQMYASNDTVAQKWYILPQNNGYIIMSAKSGRVIDAAGSNNSSNVQIYESSQTRKQVWTLTPTESAQQVSNGIYEIVAGTNSRKALDVNGGVARATNGTNVQIYERNQTDAQRWRIAYDKTNDIYLVTNVTSNLSLDVASGSLDNGANIQVYASNDTPAQRWRITKNTDNSFTILSVKSGLSLDIASGGNYDGANVWQYAANNTAAQKWQLIKISD